MSASNISVASARIVDGSVRLADARVDEDALAIRLLGNGEAGDIDCGNGIGPLDDAITQSTDHNGNILRSFHEAATNNALLTGEQDVAIRLLSEKAGEETALHSLNCTVLSVLRSDTVDEAIELINANPYGNGTAVFTNSGGAARRFMRGVKVGMIGVNVPVPVPMAYYSFGGWKSSLFGEHHIHGPEGVEFYTRGKVVTSRWPEAGTPSEASLDMPTAR